MQSIHVATIHVSEGFELDQPTESAAAFYRIAVEPGSYRVELRTSARGDRFLAAAFTGICTAAGYGAKRYESQEGQPGEVVLQPYAYQLRAGSYRGRVEIHNDAALSAVPY